MRVITTTEIPSAKVTSCELDLSGRVQLIVGGQLIAFEKSELINSREGWEEFIHILKSIFQDDDIQRGKLTGQGV